MQLPHILVSFNCWRFRVPQSTVGSDNIDFNLVDTVAISFINVKIDVGLDVGCEDGCEDG